MLSQIYSWTIHCNKWWMNNAGMVDEQCRHGTNGKQDLVENKDMSINVCINTAHFCSGNFYVRKWHLNSDIWHSHLSHSWSCEVASIKVKIFLLCFAWNSHLQKTINNALSARAFHFIYNRVNRFFRFPQNNIWLKI